MSTVQEREKFLKEFLKPGSLFRVYKHETSFLYNRLEGGDIVFVTEEISYDRRREEFKFHAITKHEIKIIKFHEGSNWAHNIGKYFEEIK